MRYRKVSTQYWDSAKARGFTADQHVAFLRILTGPEMTSVGAMRGTLAGVAAELGWPVRRLTRALAPSLAAGMVEIDEAACFIALPRFLTHNPPESPNVCKAWVRVLAGLPACPGRVAAIARCRDYLRESPAFLKAFEEAFAEAFQEAFGKTSPNQGTQELWSSGTQEQGTPDGAHTPPSDRSFDQAKGNGTRRAVNPWAGRTETRQVKL